MKILLFSFNPVPPSLISFLSLPVLTRGAPNRIRIWGCTHSASRRTIVVPRWQIVVLGEYWFYLQGENSCTAKEKILLPRKPPPTVVDEKLKINCWRLFTITIWNFLTPLSWRPHPPFKLRISKSIAPWVTDPTQGEGFIWFSYLVLHGQHWRNPSPVGN